IFNGDLVAGGGFSQRTARWDGASWLSMGTWQSSSYTIALTPYNGELIAGGNFAVADNVAVNFVARWNGSVWKPLGSGTSQVVNALSVHNGELIVGGTFTTAGNRISAYLAHWGPACARGDVNCD